MIYLLYELIQTLQLLYQLSVGVIGRVYTCRLSLHFTRLVLLIAS